MTDTDSLDKVLAALTDARAINQAIYSELVDVDDKLGLVSPHPYLLDQAQALTGIERDYLTKAIDGLKDVISQSNKNELAPAGEYNQKQ